MSLYRSDLDFQTMMAMGPFSCLVLLSFLFGKTVTTGSRKINFGQCELSGVSLWELKDYFGTVKDIVVSSTWWSMFDHWSLICKWGWLAV